MKNKRGYTLVEVLASFLIISILSVSITAVILNSISTTKDRRYRIIATSVAENYIHDIKNTINTDAVLNDEGNLPKAKWVKTTSTDNSNDGKFNDSNTVLLTKTKIADYFKTTTISDKLYPDYTRTLENSAKPLELDGVVYDSNVVSIRLGVKKYADSDYEIVVALVKIKYNGTRTMEVVRDVY